MRLNHSVVSLPSGTGSVSTLSSGSSKCLSPLSPASSASSLLILSRNLSFPKCRKAVGGEDEMGSVEVSKKRYLRIRPRRSRTESWPRIKPWVNVGWRLKTYAIPWGFGRSATRRVLRERFKFAWAATANTHTRMFVHLRVTSLRST